MNPKDLSWPEAAQVILAAGGRRGTLKKCCSVSVILAVKCVSNFTSFTGKKNLIRDDEEEHPSPTY